MKQFSKVKVWEETVILPTYEIGAPDKNPMFLEKRVYQGSSGKVYPHPVIDKIYDTKTDKEYKAVFLENDYIKVMLLPEIAENISLQLAFAGISFIRDCHTQFHNHTACIVIVVIPNFFHKSIPFSLILTNYTCLISTILL